MPLDLDTQLRAFGATLRDAVADPITPPDAAVVPLPERRPQRRWWAMAGAAACLAAAVAGAAWFASMGDPEPDAPAVVSTPPSISPITSAHVTTVPPADDPDDTLAPSPDDTATPMIERRSVRFPGCPRLAVDGVPASWSATFDEFAGVAALTAPSGTVRVSVGDYGVGESRHIDGYLATSVAGSQVVHITTNRADCPAVVVDASGLDAADESALWSALDLDDRELTEVDAEIDGTSLFGRGLFERVDADPFVAIVTERFGVPDADTGWLPVPTDFACTRAGEYRSVFWADLRVVFERTDVDEQMTAWAIGDQRTPILAPADDHRPGGALGLEASDGVHPGAEVAVLEQFPIVSRDNDGIHTVAGVIARSVSSVDGLITGVGQGRNDCI